MSTLFNAFEIPSSVVASSTASSYTIPANYFAIVRAQASNNGSILINGTIVMTSTLNTWSVLSGTVLGALPYTYNNGFGSVGTNYSLVETGGTPPTGSTAGGTALLTPAFNTNTASDSCISNQIFKVTEGVIISGSGSARYSIELYPIPGRGVS